MAVQCLWKPPYFGVSPGVRKLTCSDPSAANDPGVYEQTRKGVASEMGPAVVVGTVPGYTYSEPGSLAFLEIP